MKIIRSKQIRPLMVMAFILVMPQCTNAQFFKKLKKQAEEKIMKKADKKVDDLFKDKHKNEEKEMGHQSGNREEEGTDEMVQEKSKPEEKVSYNYSDYLVYKSPNPAAFKDIVIQKFKELPRFGAIDSYMDRDNPKKVDLSKDAADKRNLTGLGYAGFQHLVRIHMLKEHFKVMDRTALTVPTKGKIIEKEAKSSLAQKVLKEFAFTMGTDALKKEYFMNDWSGTGKSALVREWGGHQADDFTENERYVDFVEKYLDEILEWSSDFFSDGSQDFQLVHAIKFYGQYDFDKGGFWVQLPIERQSMEVSSLDYFSEFSPKTAYGNQMANTMAQVDYINGYVLFKMDPGKAEALINDKSVLLQLTMKVRSVFKAFETSNPFVYGADYTYHFLDPTLELYSDALLTKKIGEIDLENLIYKEPN
ncbi:hypothetical protein LDL77_16175 [Flagellimonas marinaquae]|uniref:hypothetical protein n=1 Tax=Flagellimonas aurea TaxID=2915619 RepID=UPI001CE1D42A|nr:hypothetical protein LDL77_16175 [Allomuricauda aquimarina]